MKYCLGDPVFFANRLTGYLEGSTYILYDSMWYFCVVSMFGYPVMFVPRMTRYGYGGVDGPVDPLG